MNLFRSKLWNFLELLGDMIILNLLFILTSLPVLTIGPSCTALYKCFFTISCGNSESLLSMYFRAFRDNFLQAFIQWIIILFFAFDVFIIMWYGYKNQIIRIWFANPVVFGLTAVVLLAFLFVLKNIFAITAFFDCNLEQGFVNSIVLPCRFFLRTVSSILVTAAFVAVVYFLPFVISLVFSLIAWIDCKLMLPAFLQISGKKVNAKADFLEKGLEEAW